MRFFQEKTHVKQKNIAKKTTPVINTTPILIEPSLMIPKTSIMTIQTTETITENIDMFLILVSSNDTMVSHIELIIKGLLK